MDYYQKYLKYKNKYLDLKQNITGGAYTGPVCINKGFRQHKGECWHDAISMALMYADEFKELTQERLYNLSVDDLISRGNPLHKPVLVTIKPELEDKYIRLAREYLSKIKQRFINHYDEYIRLQPTDIVQFHEDDSTPLQRQKSLELGIDSAVCAYKIGEIYNDIFPEDLGDKHGGSNSKVNITIELFNQYLMRSRFIYPIFITRNPSENINKYMIDKTVAIYVTCHNKDSPAGHAISFYKCNGEYYGYDNNIGLFKFDWKKNYLEKLYNQNTFGSYILNQELSIDEEESFYSWKITSVTLLLIEEENRDLLPVLKMEHYCSSLNLRDAEILFTVSEDILNYYNIYFSNIFGRPVTSEWNNILLSSLEKMLKRPHLYLFNVTGSLLKLIYKDRKYLKINEVYNLILSYFIFVTQNSNNNPLNKHMFKIMISYDLVRFEHFYKTHDPTSRSFIDYAIIRHPKYELIEHAFKFNNNDFIYSYFTPNYNWSDYKVTDNPPEHIRDCKMQYEDRYHPFVLAIKYKKYILQEYFEITFPAEITRNIDLINASYDKYDPNGKKARDKRIILRQKKERLKVEQDKRAREEQDRRAREEEQRAREEEQQRVREEQDRRAREEEEQRQRFESGIISFQDIREIINDYSMYEAQHKFHNEYKAELKLAEQKYNELFRKKPIISETDYDKEMSYINDSIIFYKKQRDDINIKRAIYESEFNKKLLEKLYSNQS